LILHVAAIIGLTLLFVLFNALFDWRRLRHVRLAVRVGLFSPMFPVLAIVVCGFCHVELATFLPGVSRALPGNLAAAVAVAGIALAALYWAVGGGVRVTGLANAEERPQECGRRRLERLPH
jgi:hypothetical protein